MTVPNKISSKVTICIPAYNNVQALQRCLNSIVEQDFLDFDIIITDDSSTNEVCNAVQAFDFKNIKCQYYKNIIALKSPENWNYCIAKATGEYIKIMHHDDWFTYPNSLSTFVNMMEANAEKKPSLGLVSVRAVDIKNNSTLHISVPTDEWLDRIQKYPLEILCANFIGPPSAVIYRNGLGITYDKSLKWYVDMEFYINVLKNINPVVVCDKLDAVSIGISDTQISRECEYNPNVLIFELLFTLKKWNVKLVNKKDPIFRSTLQLFKRFEISAVKHIRQYYKGQLPNGLYNILLEIWFEKMKIFLRRVRKKCVREINNFIIKIFFFQNKNIQ